MIAQVLNDLLAEGKLDADYDVTEFSLQPRLFEVTERQCREAEVAWVGFIEAVGKKNGFFSTEDSTVVGLSSNPRRVFVVHGRDENNRRAMFELLRAVDLEPIEWEEAVALTGEGAPYVGNVLEALFNTGQAVIVLMTGDDEARLRPAFKNATDGPAESDLRPQPRPNVIFEAGMALSRSPDRTILVQIGDLRSISNIAGRHVLRFAGTPQDRNALVSRLKSAGCPVKTEGKRDWLSAGSFIVETQ